MVAPTIIEILFGVARLNLGTVEDASPYEYGGIARYADKLKQTVFVYFTVNG